MAFLLFLFEEHLRFSLAFIALSAAAAALVIVQPPVRDVFQRIQWDIILFFTGLFVMIGGLQASMIFHYLAILMKMMSFLPPNFFGVIILWLVAILSALIDNVPITMAMIPVIKEIGLLGYPISALWWALAFGAGFGGNGTIIGSTANIVVVSISEKTRAPITPSLWHRRGLPIMIATCFYCKFTISYFLPTNKPVKLTEDYLGLVTLFICLFILR
jgi:Na+/H+ antiporter NhaD/arsenite permease-like protein